MLLMLFSEAGICACPTRRHITAYGEIRRLSRPSAHQHGCGIALSSEDVAIAVPCAFLIWLMRNGSSGEKRSLHRGSDELVAGRTSELILCQ